MSQVPQHGGSPLGGLGQPGWFKEFASFRKMITPIVIQVLFWIMVVGCVITGIMMISTGPIGALGGILFIPLGVLGARIWCELIILIFRMRDLLEDIRNNTGK
jgi:hypothetical protein